MGGTIAANRDDVSGSLIVLGFLALCLILHTKALRALTSAAVVFLMQAARVLKSEVSVGTSAAIA